MKQVLLGDLVGRTKRGYIPVLGAGLLSPDTDKDRRYLMDLYGAAYAGILIKPEQTHGLWKAANRELIEAMARHYERRGYEAPPATEDAIYAKILYPLRGTDPIGHVRLIEALFTDYSERFAEHVRYRLNHAGNLHIEFIGGTGSGKSSCALTVADWISPIEPASLLDHLGFDQADLPAKLRGKKPGQTVLQDELIQAGGEGSRTMQIIAENIEDTLRASQVNLFRCSPRRQDCATSQMQLEAIFWNPTANVTVFLVWIEDVPHGVMAIPWVRDELWRVYSPWKEANVQRSLSGHFKDNAYFVTAAMRLFADSRFVGYLMAMRKKPVKTDFQTAIELFHPQLLAGTQVERLVSIISSLTYGYGNMRNDFTAWFGTQPNEGFLRVAEKCSGARKAVTPTG